MNNPIALEILAVMFLLAPSVTAAQGAAAVPPAPAASLPYPIVDTGQVTCYNNASPIAAPSAGQPFHGQDAQIAGRQPSYTLGADGLTVADNVTGLTWQRSPDTNGDGVINVSDKFTWAQAQSRPAALNAAHYGGFDDWRLPTIKELYSLMNFNGGDPSGYNGTDTSGLTPFIDTDSFDFAYGDTSAGERIIDAQYASCTLYVYTAGGTKTKLFGLNLADGRIKGYDLQMPGGAEKTFLVQCVRGNPDYGVNHFVDNGDQTVTDLATGLMWSRADSGAALNWQDALAWVQARNAANFLGHSDWRLPNAKELQSILDYTRSPDTSGTAAIDPVFAATAFVDEGGAADAPWYWTGTTHTTWNGMGANAVYLCFGRAGGWQKSPPSAACYTLFDVHGAGAQRSDPKTLGGRVVIGTACAGGTAYGLGPQGDVQRGVNFVRLVRDAGSAPTVGDLNADGAVNAADLALLAGILAGNVTTAPSAADVNQDAAVNVIDLVDLVRLVL
ncbi:MAG: DUF1566 domain-containing protein [Acidobacteria bacterium]|nr:DUF1566 domain-containing protein [Acidobacteriota bacterium]